MKATALIAKHDKSDWHKAAMEKQSLSLLSQKRGNVVEQSMSVSEVERQQNRELIKLVRSLYFLVKHHIPHTTMFEGLITLQNENGDIKKNYRENCPCSATYESNATVVELLASISKILESDHSSSFKASTYFSLTADESTDFLKGRALSKCTMVE